MIKKITFLIWLFFLIAWNYWFPEASPWEDVFVSVCLYLFKNSIDQHICE